MKAMHRSIGLTLFAALLLAACGGGGGGGSTPPTTPAWEGQLISNPSVSPVTAFRQTVASDGTNTTYYEIFPGQANAWTLNDYDFSLEDGFGNQFFYALDLTVGTDSLINLNLPQTYSELTFYTPYLTAADGVKVAEVSDGSSLGLASFPGNVPSTLTGSYAAFLNATSDSRLQQILDLTSLPTGTTINISWTDAVSASPGLVAGYNPSYQVVVRSESGALLRTLFSTPTGLRQIHSGMLLDQYAGQRVVLSFEMRSSTISFGGQAYAIIDAVSVTDNSSTEYVTNGGFESGDITGWTTNTPQEVQNMTSGSRTLDGLNVKRSFYTAPNKLWGRWVDVFTNPSVVSAVTRTITYQTSLGSFGEGVIYSSTSGTKSLTSWHDRAITPTGGRDIGWVFGNASTVSFTSDDGTGTVGSDIIEVTFSITVQPGGSVALVNFIIMDGHDTGGESPAGYDPAKKASAIDTAAAGIVNNFRTDEQYRRGMTQAQFNAIQNF